jgi:hypothetical protein
VLNSNFARAITLETAEVKEHPTASSTHGFRRSFKVAGIMARRPSGRCPPIYQRMMI